MTSSGCCVSLWVFLFQRPNLIFHIFGVKVIPPASRLLISYMADARNFRAAESTLGSLLYRKDILYANKHKAFAMAIILHHFAPCETKRGIHAIYFFSALNLERSSLANNNQCNAPVQLSLLCTVHTCR
jgi:hypothetical protein